MVCLVIVLGVFGVKSQTPEQFKEYIRTEGFQYVAAWAHPTSVFQSGNVELNDRTVKLTVNYTTWGGNYCRTVFEICLNYYGVITDIDVPYDDDWYPAFQATTDMKFG